MNLLLFVVFSRPGVHEFSVGIFLLLHLILHTLQKKRVKLFLKIFQFAIMGTGTLDCQAKYGFKILFVLYSSR